MTTYYNVIDEKGRYCGLKIDLEGKPGQEDTHTFSYMCVREIEKDMEKGKPIGLESQLGE